jgi:hypothetical protein
MMRLQEIRLILTISQFCASVEINDGKPKFGYLFGKLRRAPSSHHWPCTGHREVSKLDRLDKGVLFSPLWYSYNSTRELRSIRAQQTTGGMAVTNIQIRFVEYI